MRATPFIVCLSSPVAARRLPLLPLLPLLLSLACGLATDESQSPLGITLGVSPTALIVTDTLHLSLSNASTASAGYNLCWVSLDKNVAGRWLTFPWLSSRVCTAELRGLSPGQTAHGVVVLPSSLRPGIYRVRTGIEWPRNGHQREVVSQQFTVLP